MPAFFPSQHPVRAWAWLIGGGILVFILCAIVVLPVLGLRSTSYTLSSPPGYPVDDVSRNKIAMPMAIGGAAEEITSGADYGAVPPGSPMPMMGGGGATTADRLQIGPKIIKNGSLSLRVDHVDQNMVQISTLATNAGGFVADSRVVDNGGTKTGSITLRLPSEKFDQTVIAIKKLAIVVFDESSNAQDVTDQFIDLTARLKSAQAEEAQYLTILKQAKTVEDTLNVTARLAEVRTRIEQLQGQLRYLTDRTDLATLSITLTEETNVSAPTRTWQPGETLRQAFQNLVLALQQFFDIGVTVLVFLVGLVLPIVLFCYLIIRLCRWLWKKAFGKKR